MSELLHDTVKRFVKRYKTLEEIIPNWSPKLKKGVLTVEELKTIAEDGAHCVMGEALKHDTISVCCEQCAILSSQFGAWAYYNSVYDKGGQVDKIVIAEGEVKNCDCDADEELGQECYCTSETAYADVADGDEMNLDVLLHNLETHWNEVHMDVKQ